MHLVKQNFKESCSLTHEKKGFLHACYSSDSRPPTVSASPQSKTARTWSISNSCSPCANQPACLKHLQEEVKGSMEWTWKTLGKWTKNIQPSDDWRACSIGRWLCHVFCFRACWGQDSMATWLPRIMIVWGFELALFCWEWPVSLGKSMCFWRPCQLVRCEVLVLQASCPVNSGRSGTRMHVHDSWSPGHLIFYKFSTCQAVQNEGPNLEKLHRRRLGFDRLHKQLLGGNANAVEKTPKNFDELMHRSGCWTGGMERNGLGRRKKPSQILQKLQDFCVLVARKCL